MAGFACPARKELYSSSTRSSSPPCSYSSGLSRNFFISPEARPSSSARSSAPTLRTSCFACLIASLMALPFFSRYLSLRYLIFSSLIRESNNLPDRRKNRPAALIDKSTTRNTTMPPITSNVLPINIFGNNYS